MAENENTETHKVVFEQLGTGAKATVTIETPPGTTYKEAMALAREQGEAQAAEALGMTSAEYRSASATEKAETRRTLVQQVKFDKDGGLSNAAIAQKHNLSESTVRHLLK
jgi:DNA-binding NarL/FixJ family response regulator